MGRVEGENYPGLTAVAAITDDFGLAVLQEKSDRDRIGTRLRAKETDEYVSLAGRAETGMRIIERETLTLKARTSQICPKPICDLRKSTERHIVGIHPRFRPPTPQ